ncbi:hypothetical protein BJV74DRAFT_882406 [Russula compacta]|nr:hypothetical protein BJV74DRAFT_882406 [Russula compacta]
MPATQNSIYIFNLFKAVGLKAGLGFQFSKLGPRHGLDEGFGPAWPGPASGLKLGQAQHYIKRLSRLWCIDLYTIQDGDTKEFCKNIRAYNSALSFTSHGSTLDTVLNGRGIDCEKLMQLAYLLGSDYVEGLPGVGPVVAMELLKEFPGGDGLHKFKDWWQRVQSGRDKPEESQSKFRQRFKRRFRTLYIPDDWPNPVVVSGCLLPPTIDDSEEPFKWGLPDLDRLRDFLLQELGWRQSKAEELPLPIIQKIQKHNQVCLPHHTARSSPFLTVNSAGGVVAPRNRKAYASKRLQQVVNDFRDQRKREAKSGNKDAQDDVSSSSSSGGDVEVPPQQVAERGKGRGGSSIGDTGKKRERGGKGSARGARAGPKRKRRRSITTSSGSDDGAFNLDMSDSDYHRLYLESNYKAYDNPKGLIHVFSQISNGFRGIPNIDPIDITWTFLGLYWDLQGIIILPALNINAKFYFTRPFLPPVLLAHVKGSLKGEGVVVNFDVPYSTKGRARFFEKDSFLWVHLIVEELLGHPIDPPEEATIKLYEIPVKLGQAQYQ